MLIARQITSFANVGHCTAARPQPAATQLLPSPHHTGIIEPFYLGLPSWINMGIVNCCVGQGFWIHDLFFFTLLGEHFTINWYTDFQDEYRVKGDQQLYVVVCC